MDPWFFLKNFGSMTNNGENTRSIDINFMAELTLLHGGLFKTETENWDDGLNV